MILVTGSAGLVGRELIDQLLLQGKKVRAIYHNNKPSNLPREGLEWIQCDVLDITTLEELMMGVEYVYHCAAIVSFNPSRQNELYKINIEGTANVVNAALNSGVKKLVHVSSVAALGKSSNNNAPISESDKWNATNNTSSYGKSKYYSELEVWRAMGEGLDIVIVNPAIILGPGDWTKGSSQVFKNVYDEFPWYSDGENGFVDVRDVAKAMISLMESDISGQNFILCGRNTSYREVFDLIAKGFNKKAPYKKVTPFLAKLVWRLEAIKSIFTGKDPLVTKETAISALSKSCYNNSKLLTYLPSFQYATLEDTVSYTCQKFQQFINKQ